MNDILHNELFEAFANAADNVYVYVCDMPTNISRWSKNAVDYFGLPDEYLEDAGTKWMEKIHPNDRNMYLRDINAVFSGKSSQHYCQYRAKNVQGEYVWLECKGSVIYDNNGTPKIFAGLMTRLNTKNKYDSLTNLLTSHEFFKYDFSVGHGCVLLFGMDDFRKITNRLGYNYGDHILTEFSTQLEQLSEEGRLVFRYQGDEFIIVSPDHDADDSMQLFERILAFGAKIQPGDEYPHPITFTGGIVEYPSDGTSQDVLLNNAEHCLKYAKSSERGHAILFSAEIARQRDRSLNLGDALSNSILHDFSGFELYYQPMIDARTHRISACEALLRWKSPEISDSNPAEFIKSLEETGEIRKVGLWVMEEVMKRAKKWQKRYGLSISFNTSYLQFTDGDFVRELINKANQYDVNPHNIIIELTESYDVGNPLELSAYFSQLQENGFRIALDDFGTAYSTLGLVHTLPTDLIKVDHSFVRELDSDESHTDLTIIESVVSMCNKLSVGVVVEGVESKEIEEIISCLNVDFLQGYLYSRPVNETEFEKLLEKGYLY